MTTTLQSNLYGLYPKMIVKQMARFDTETLVQCPYCDGWSIHHTAKESSRLCDNYQCSQFYYIPYDDIQNRSIKTHGIHLEHIKIHRYGKCITRYQLKACCKRRYDK